MINSHFESSDINEDILTLEEDAEFMANIDMNALDKIIEEIEKTEDDPNEWIPFDEVILQIHKEVFSEDL